MHASPVLGGDRQKAGIATPAHDQIAARSESEPAGSREAGETGGGSRTHQHFETFRRHPGRQRCFAFARSRPGRRPDGRQRRRQVDAGQDDRRQLPAEPWHHAHGRQGTRPAPAGRSAPARHRDRPSGPGALQQSDGGGERLPRPRTAARRRAARASSTMPSCTGAPAKSSRN